MHNPLMGELWKFHTKESITVWKITKVGKIIGGLCVFTDVPDKDTPVGSVYDDLNIQDNYYHAYWSTITEQDLDILKAVYL